VSNLIDNSLAERRILRVARGHMCTKSKNAYNTWSLTNRHDPVVVSAPITYS